MSRLIILFGVISCFQPALLISGPDSPTYVAGVVEYFKIRYITDEPREAAENLKNYLGLINSPEATDIDILVFPESSLNNRATAVYVPEPEDNVDPCTDTATGWDPLITEISCAAKQTKKYIVINLTEKSNCPDKQQIRFNDTRPCSEKKINQYNANVVFNRNGVVVSKYRKHNLFGEDGILSPLLPESLPFTTDFNVTFGQFICFDLMFDRPALDLIKQDVTDFLFPTMWFSELPFLTAAQPQLSWAYKHNVNFLAAGASFPGVGSTGSGIYNGRNGALTALMSDVPESKILKAVVSKIGTNLAVPTVRIPEIDPAKMLRLRLKRDQLDGYNTTLLVPNQHYSSELCSGKMCCHFTVNTEFQEELIKNDAVAYQYRLAAFDGVRTFDGFADGGVKVCAIFACTDDTLASCGTRFDKSSEVVSALWFKTLEIRTEFDLQDNLLVIPNTVTTSILPLQPDMFDYQEEKASEGKTSATITLLQNVSNLYTFSVYARDFSRDQWTWGERNVKTEL